MRTIALRFGDNIAPECGTIEAHKKMIVKNGFVWWGKFGAKINEQTIKGLLKCDEPRILLINSGKYDRYWARIEDVLFEPPVEGESPAYYWDKRDTIKTWFKVTNIEIAPRDVMSKCKVASSGKVLSEASMHSMSPFFIIDFEEGE